MAECSSTIRLESCDAAVFEVDRNIFKHSNTINTIIEDLGIGEGGDVSDLILLCRINAATLQKLIEWCEYYKRESHCADVVDNGTVKTELSAWDVAFFHVDQGTLFNILMAAHSLELVGLRNAACQVVADMIKGKSPDEIRAIFNLKNDFTPEEQKQINLENPWCQKD